MEDRKSNFELLRIFCMFMIVLYHVILHGHVLENSQSHILSFACIVIVSLIIMHANIFFILTGYFQCRLKFNLKKIIHFTIEVLFYNLLVIILFSIFHIEDFSFENFLKHLFLLDNSKNLWFVKIYFCLYVFSPFINYLIKSLTRKKHKFLIIISVIILCLIPYLTGNNGIIKNDGFTLYNAFVLYIIGAYIRMYPLENTGLDNYRKKMFLNYLLFAFVNLLVYSFSSYYSLNYKNIFSSILFNFAKESFFYQNPLIIMQSIYFFLFFKCINLTSKFVNFISKSVFAVYLITDNSLMEKYLYKWLLIDNGVIESFNFIFYVFLITIIIFVYCIFIDLIRRYLFKYIYDSNFCKKIDNKIKKYIAIHNFDIDYR